MDVFWPDAHPEAARNRLHVALHNIRQKLRDVTDMPVVMFQDGAYHLNPDFHLWVDADEFDWHVETGHRLETAGQITKATTEYELAIGLYQDDLLADDPYEEWPVLMREHLRVAYLDTLDRLSHIYFDRGEYAVCVAVSTYPGSTIAARMLLPPHDLPAAGATPPRAAPVPGLREVLH
jgi:DNA-binding SARP family transcriptional activator